MVCRLSISGTDYSQRAKKIIEINPIGTLLISVNIRRVWVLFLFIYLPLCAMLSISSNQVS